MQYPRTGNPTNGGYNYHFQQQYIDLEKGYTVLNTIFNAKVTLPYGFTYQFNIAPRFQWFYDRYWMSAELPDSKPADRGSNRNTSKTFNWNLNNTLTWDRTFNKEHHFTVTLVQEAEENRYWYDEIHARNITPSDVLGFHYISGANKEQSSFYTNDTHYTAAAYLGRLFYGFKDRYLLTATVRRDGSSRFGADHKWGLFPSAAASWRISQEHFWGWEAMNDLKLRYSFGITGNQEIGNYQSLNTLAASSNGYLVGGSKITIILPAQYSNPDLKWEETAQHNIGLDFGFLDSRIRGSFDWYYKKTDDLLLSVDVPAPSLITRQIANVGSVENKGVEFEIAADIIRTKDWRWDISLNMSHNSNEVTSLSNDKWTGDDVLTAACQGQGLSGSYSQRIKEGYSIGTFWGKEYLGIVDGKETYRKNDDGSDWVGEIGCAMPDLSYGITTNVHYKNWSMGIVMRGTIGNEVYNCTANNLMYTGNLPGRNILREALDSGITYGEPKAFSSRFVEDASFLRLDNLNIGYDFAVKAMHISHARVSLSAQNLFVITGYSGLDPEVSSVITSNGMSTLGMDYLSYPRARTFTLGLNLTF